MKETLTIKVNKKLDGEQLFKVSRFKEVIKRTKPHKHDSYFELIYLSEGAGFHWIDTEKFQITPPIVFFLSGQLHYWEMTAIPKGYVMLFWEMMHGSRTDWAMLLGGIFLLIKGGGRWSFDQNLWAKWK